MLERIPQEMRALPQWVCAGPNKVPLNPRTGQEASPTNPATWASFDEACRAGCAHVGFVLSRSDPYCIIDLDNPFRGKQKELVTPEHPDYAAACGIMERHNLILGAFASYAELSQSGEGVHIIVRGSIPHGVRRDKVEVYSSERYMICTGRVLNDYPISDAQHLLDGMYAQMASTESAELVESGDTLQDAQLWQMATTASNAAKFCALWNGDWQGRPEYPSQSEADFALMSILAFYSQSNEQCRRFFRWSALGQREKATRNNKYLDYALKKIRGRQVPLVDLSAFLNQSGPPVQMDLPGLAPEPAALPAVVDSQEGESTVPPRPLSQVVLPPGIVGECAAYIYASATRQVPEIALMAALALVAGIVGRSFHISGTGLNQYLMLLAKTGMGKEGAAGGIDALIAAVRRTVPMADEFLGPGTFASGQALTRALDKTPCFVSVLGEVGLTLKKICDPKATPADIQLRKVLLDLYAKSGPEKFLRPSVYSDTDKNTGTVRAPNVTVLGESTPVRFFEAINQSHIAEGLIPRFLVIEYDGQRPARNPYAFAPPPGDLVARLVEMVTLALATKQADTCAPVQIAPAAQAVLDAFDREADARINSQPGDIEIELWNRAHLKALKLAGVIAAGCNIHQPVVNLEIAEWSIALVRRDVEGMAGHFARGDVGQGDHSKETAVREALKAYFQMTPDSRKAYKVPNGLLNSHLVPYVYLKRRLRNNKIFVEDVRGAHFALDAILSHMVKAGALALIPEIQARTELGTNAPVYAIGEAY